MFLELDSFENIVKFSPIAAIDLCILNEKNEILLGKRINPPAKNYFFVPGGRIRKSEKISNAIRRILKDEINFEINDENLAKINFLGVFEHFYDDNFYGNKFFKSHYVVLAYSIQLKMLNKIKTKKINDQHEYYIWYGSDRVKEIKIHQYAKDYLDKI